MRDEQTRRSGFTLLTQLVSPTRRTRFELAYYWPLGETWSASGQREWLIESVAGVRLRLLRLRPEMPNG
ncbi:MAG: hypothetical protein ACRENP_25185 [Longimicrobiales bacterium]